MSKITIGQYIKQKRVEKDIALSFASEKTKIHHRLLEDFENDNFSKLPNPIYLKGFINQLSKILDLDNELALKLLEADYQSYLVQNNTLPDTTLLQADNKSLNDILEFFNCFTFLFTWKHFIWITSAGIFIFAIIFAGTELTKSDFTKNRYYGAIMSKKLFQNMVTSTIPQAKIIPPPAPVILQKFSIKSINNESWISYQTDKIPIKRLTLVKDKELLLEGSQIKLVIGRPEAIQIISNGQEINLKPFITLSGTAVVVLPVQAQDTVPSTYVVDNKNN